MNQTEPQTVCPGCGRKFEFIPHMKYWMCEGDCCTHVFAGPNNDPTGAGIDALVRSVKASDDRRERIATACLAGILAFPGANGDAEQGASIAVRFADALIARLEMGS